MPEPPDSRRPPEGPTAPPAEPTAAEASQPHLPPEPPGPDASREELSIWDAYWERFRIQQVDDPVEDRREGYWDRFRRQQVDDPVPDRLRRPTRSSTPPPRS